MLSRLPISLAPLKAQNNSKKKKFLKKIRKILCSSYRLKNFCKNIYKHKKHL